MTHYSVVPMFWGATFPRGAEDPNFPATPYAPEDFRVALTAIANAGYFSRLTEYGAEQVSIADPFISDDPWPDNGNGYYVADFTADQVVSFIQKHLPDVAPAPGATPIYGVVIPNGSLLDVEALGAHHVFSNGSQSGIWFWIYGSNSLSNVCQVATHEIVEAIGADFGVPNELCDDCRTRNPGGRKLENGLIVETYYDQGNDLCVAPGTTWQDQQMGIGGGTSARPALAAFDNKLFAAWKGVGDDQRMFWSSFDGTAWAPQQLGIGGGSSDAPALAFFGGRLFAVWKGVNTDERMFWSSFDGNTWAPQQVGVGGGTSGSPALATLGGRLIAAWKGSGDDQRMFWSSFDGNVWSGQQVGIGGGTSTGIALASVGDRLIAGWKGAGDDQRMFWSSFDGNVWSSQQLGIGGGTASSPALAALGDQIYAAWRGVANDEQMYWSRFDGHSWSPQKVGIGGGTSAGPSLGAFRSELFAAWKGVDGDERMFWSSLCVP